VNILQWWVIGELSVIVIGLSFLTVQIWRRARSQPGIRLVELPKTFTGCVAYVSRLGGLLMLIFLFVILERNILTVILETAPAPSHVPAPEEAGLEAEEVTFQSPGGPSIAGWFVPSKNGATIILLHGYGGNRTAMLWHAERLIEAGYGVLLYDERASGESEGGYRSYGWEDTRDVEAALQYLSTREDAADKVGIAGCSTGADIAVYSMALYPQLGAAWGDGNSSVRAQDMPPIRDWITMFLVPSNYMLDWMYTVRLGIDAPAPLVDVIDDIAPRPLMLVGGGVQRPVIGSEADLFTLRFAELAGPNAQAWIIPEAAHCDGPRVRPEEYAQKMVTFFDSALGIK